MECQTEGRRRPLHCLFFHGQEDFRKGFDPEGRVFEPLELRGPYEGSKRNFPRSARKKMGGAKKTDRTGYYENFSKGMMKGRNLQALETPQASLLITWGSPHCPFFP